MPKTVIVRMYSMKIFATSGRSVSGKRRKSETDVYFKDMAARCVNESLLTECLVLTRTAAEKT